MSTTWYCHVDFYCNYTLHCIFILTQMYLIQPCRSISNMCPTFVQRGFILQRALASCTAWLKFPISMCNSVRWHNSLPKEGAVHHREKQTHTHKHHQVSAFFLGLAKVGQQCNMRPISNERMLCNLCSDNNSDVNRARGQFLVCACYTTVTAWPHNQTGLSAKSANDTPQ